MRRMDHRRKGEGAESGAIRDPGKKRKRDNTKEEVLKGVRYQRETRETENQ